MACRPGHSGASRPPGGGGAPVEWYQAGGAQFAAADYSYPAADGGPTSGAYGSFEDEPPLLEGAVPCKPFGITSYSQQGFENELPLLWGAQHLPFGTTPVTASRALRSSRRSWRARCPANPFAQHCFSQQVGA